MKPATRILFFVLLLPVFLQAQTGADCSTAIPLTMDGVCRNYATSATTDVSLHCVDNTGNAPITYFSFTTNSNPDKILINITGPSNQPVEIVMYPSNCSFAYSSSRMCFNDGNGIWSPSNSFSMSANTTYKLRVRTNAAGTINMCAKYNVPVNDNCAGALSISSTPLLDNNANHTAGPSVSAVDLCAGSLENTAFYKYTIASTGVSIINLNNINCDNEYGSNSNGFQVGFFNGSCGSLVPISCYSGIGSFVTATTSILPAGTQVVVAIDGTANSRCSYEINAINALVLAADIKNFNAWKKPISNLLTWTTVQELRNDYFEIERSEDGKNFISIGRVAGQMASYSEQQYELNDPAPPVKSYYRLKQVNKSGESSYYKTILVIRKDQNGFDLFVNSPVDNTLHFTLQSVKATPIIYRVVTMNGQVIKQETINIQVGSTAVSKNIASLPAALYLLEVQTGSTALTQLFLKSK